MSTDSFFTPDLPEETIYHVGVSGGKDSTAVLLWMIHESGVPHHKIDATFADTGNEHPDTLEHIRLISETVFPIQTIRPALPFFELVQKHRLFPSEHRRYCTRELKILPAQQHITGLLAAAKAVVSVSGIRSDESDKRKHLEEWDYSNAVMSLQWRPIIRYTLEDVLAIHRKYNVPLNPLYEKGARRVGCFPCLYSSKAEIRMAAQICPEKIAFIGDQERLLQERTGNVSGFFDSRKVPERFRNWPYTRKDGSQTKVATVDDVVRWSMTGKRAKGSYLDDESLERISCTSGFCE